MVNDDSIFYRHNLRRSTYKEEVEVDGKKMVYTNDIRVNVKRSNSDESYIVIQKESRGKNKSSANSNARKVNYKYEIIDNTIVLDAYFLSAYKNMWKDEEVNIIIYLPTDATVYFDNSTKNFLADVRNETDIYDKEMVNHHFIMTDSTLKCSDCIEEIFEEVEEVIKEKTIKKVEKKLVKELEEIKEETI
jgi:hypothetical protein